MSRIIHVSPKFNPEPDGQVRNAGLVRARVSHTRSLAVHRCRVCRTWILSADSLTAPFLQRDHRERGPWAPASICRTPDRTTAEISVRPGTHGCSLPSSHPHTHEGSHPRTHGGSYPHTQEGSHLHTHGGLHLLHPPLQAMNSAVPGLGAQFYYNVLWS